MRGRVWGVLITGLVWWAGVWWAARADVTLAPAWRVGLFCVSVSPLALFMGGIFPSLLARLEQQGVSRAWAISGLMSVTGSIAVAVLSFRGGTWGVAAFALLMYASMLVNEKLSYR